MNADGKVALCLNDVENADISRLAAHCRGDTILRHSGVGLLPVAPGNEIVLDDPVARFDAVPDGCENGGRLIIIYNVVKAIEG